jgi:hypothetical protein
MTFFEAWGKAEEGDKLKFDVGCFIIKSSGGEIRAKQGHMVNQGCLFRKEWSIIPPKETVVVDIPENAENVFVEYHGSICPHLFKKEGIKKITYEIPS